MKAAASRRRDGWRAGTISTDLREAWRAGASLALRASPGAGLQVRGEQEAIANWWSVSACSRPPGDTSRSRHIRHGLADSLRPAGTIPRVRKRGLQYHGPFLHSCAIA